MENFETYIKALRDSLVSSDHPELHAFDKMLGAWQKLHERVKDAFAKPDDETSEKTEDEKTE